MKPVIFVSAVSREFKSARQLVANTLHALGYEPDWQDVSGMEGGDLWQGLRKKIDRSSAVFQIVGDAYGVDLPAPDPAVGRVSYTQYEAKYAKDRGKLVYYLLAKDGFPRDEPAAAIDSPRGDGPAALADAEERRRLQAAYRGQILAGGHAYREFDGPKDCELELVVRKLRDNLQQLWRRERLRRAATAALLLLIAGVVPQGRPPGQAKARARECWREELGDEAPPAAARLYPSPAAATAGPSARHFRIVVRVTVLPLPRRPDSVRSAWRAADVTGSRLPLEIETRLSSPGRPKHMSCDHPPMPTAEVREL